MNVNLIIPKRNRNDRLPICLHYLNQANAAQRYDVAVYIVDDAEHPVDFSPFTNLTVHYLVKPHPQNEPFRQAVLLNYGIQQARSTFDWFSLIDLDMIYSATFFDTVAQNLAGLNYILSHGRGLDQPTTQTVVKHRPRFEAIDHKAHPPFVSFSQVSCSKQWYQLYQDIFQTEALFDESFYGWGNQDVVLDHLANALYWEGLSDKIMLPDLWLHLYHPRAEVSYKQDRDNTAHIYRLDTQNEAIIRRFKQQRQPPSQVSQLFIQAQQAHQQGHLPQAEQLYQNVIQLDPKHSEAYHMLGLIKSQQHNYVAAVQLLEQAISLNLEIRNISARNVYNNLGEVWRLQGELGKAVEGYKEALHLNLFFPEAHYNLANVYKVQRRYAEATQHYDWAIKVKPDYLNAYHNLGNCLLEMGQVQRAIWAYQQALQINPNFVAIHFQLAKIWHQQGQLNEAIRHYQQVITVDPQSDEAYFQLGNVFQDAGRLEESVAAYQQALARNPNSPGAHQNLGATLMEQRNYSAAIEHYEQVIKLDPSHSGAHYNMGLALEMQGKVDAAKTAYRHTLKLNPTDRLLQFHLETLCPLIPSSNTEIDAYRTQVNQVLDEFIANPPRLDMNQLHLAQVMPPYVLSYQGRNELPLKAKWAEVFRSQLSQGDPSPPQFNHDKPHIGFVVTKG
ncbi:MAG: tetratricopeptide repeat protein, partial [Chloroflexota bacterium]